MKQRFALAFSALTAALAGVAGSADAQVPMTTAPVVQIVPAQIVPVQIVPVQLVPLQAVPVQPVAAVPIVAPPADPPGNMLARMIAKIDVKDEIAIRNGPEGATDWVFKRHETGDSPQYVAVPVVFAPMGPVGQGVYTVRSGGSLSAVANRTGARIEDLIALNPALPTNQRLDAGTQVWLPFPWPP